MERKIGEIFEFGGDWYQCVKELPTGGCVGCAFFTNAPCAYASEGNGSNIFDHTGLIFKKLEKYGGFIKDNIRGEICQPYTIFDIDRANSRDDRVQFSEDKNDFVFVVTKQKQEDMEEKNNGNTPLNVLTDKYVNGDICYDDFEKEVKALYSCKEEIKPTLKDFDLEAAKQGKPVYTRDGRKARIVCYDFKGGDYPIIALVECRGNREIFCAYSEKGEIGIGTKTDEDLMIAPELHEGWVNIYRDADTGRIWASQIYKTELAAMEFAPKAMGYITAVKIEWEE